MMDTEVIRRAASLIGERGHCKFSLTDEAGHLCVMGALVEAGSFSIAPILLATEFYPAVDKVVREQFPGRVGSCPAFYTAVSFNNHPDTTGEEVIAVLEKTAARLDEALEEAA
jgi:hypothetical protein